MRIRPDILLVSGAGKKVGKTTLVCNLLKAFSGFQITAIKIAPHFHELTPKQEVLERNHYFILTREHEINPLADSSRYLHAGAVASYYLQVKDDALLTAFTELESHIDTNHTPLIIESAALRKHVIPGVHFYIAKEEAAIGNETNSTYDAVTTYSKLATFEYTKQIQINPLGEWEKIKK